jgi:hypothetical protein
MLARSFVVALVATAALALASGVSEARLSLNRDRLERFANCDDLVRYGRAQLRRERRVGGGPGVGAPAVAEPAAGAGDSSTTNVQEAGVDEPDIVKSQGTTIFAVADGRLHAVDAGGDSPRVLDTLKLPWGVDELLVSGDRALAIRGGGAGWLGGGLPMAMPDGMRTYPSGTVLSEVDVGDPSHLRVVRTESIDGDYLSARLTGTTARVVVSSTPLALTKRSLRTRARGWRPTATVRDARTGRRKRHALGSCRSIRRPQAFSGLDALTVLTIDMTRGLPEADADSILTDGQLVYASPSNVYVATERWLGGNVGRREPPKLTTAIHKFAAPAAPATSYRASGHVDGSLLSQWSMSDHGGALRVASTSVPWWWDGQSDRTSESSVTALAEHAGRLVPVGRVGGLGRGQRIYAVRFIGDTGYVVTFRELDPLYTLDLSDPARPRVAGELELRGYSAYLHPVGPNLLLGVGQEATGRGRTLGTQLSLFDVSDPGHPTRLSHYAIGRDSDSEVEYDHHAFFWWPPAKLAILPVWIYQGDEDTIGGKAIGFTVDRSQGIQEIGRTTHDGNSEVERSLVVGGRLYTMGYDGIARNDMTTLQPLGFAAFPPVR